MVKFLPGVLLFSILTLLCSVPMHAAEVCNAGFPGANTTQLRDRLPEALAACPEATVVVLFAGMNDAANPARFLSPAQTQQNVEQMLRSIRSTHAAAVLVTVHLPDTSRLLQRHRVEEYAGHSPQERVEAVNTALAQAAHDASATVVDFHGILARAGGANHALSTDGVHLTREGYRILAAAVGSALPKGTSTVLCFGDSLTYGIGVRAPDAADAGSFSYPQQLRMMLDGSL